MILFHPVKPLHNPNKEVWVEMFGFDLPYEISNQCHVRRLDCVSLAGRNLKERVLAGSYHFKGPKPLFGLAFEGERRIFSSSRLIADYLIADERPLGCDWLIKIDPDRKLALDNICWTNCPSAWGFITTGEILNQLDRS